MAGGGGLLVISPVGFLAALIAGVLMVALTRFMSLGSIVGATVAGVSVVWQGLISDMPLPLLFYGTAVPGFVYWTHRSNIHRLLSGTERKVSRSATHR
jgi:glycerol-3-phosphate acyltransferase PlsY